MAANDVLIRRGTATTLGSAGTTFTLACGSGSGVQSSVFDLGDPHADEYEMTARVCLAAAPTAGGTLDFYLAPTVDAVNYPGGATGADGQYMSSTTLDASLPSLSYLGSIIVAALSGVHYKSMVIAPITRSGSLVMDNNTTAASIILSGLITLTPLIPQVQTA
jgi:hypothetical protein